MCDGAKDKGNTAIDDDSKIENKQQEDTQVADEYTYSDGSESDSGYQHKLHPVALLFPLDHKGGDGKPRAFEAKPFKSASRFLQKHKCDSGIMIVDTSKETLELLQKFCEEYAKIKDEYAKYEVDISVNEKMIDFTCQFVEDHWRSSIELVKVAYELDIKVLVYWMMGGVDKLFMAAGMDEDEVYNFLFVNYKVYDESELMEPRHLLGWRSLLTDSNGEWDPKLLKKNFHEYKNLSDEQRRQWLTAHFLLRDSPLAWKLSKRIEFNQRSFKAERALVNNPIYIETEKKMKWKSKRSRRKGGLDKQQELGSHKRKLATSFDATPDNDMETMQRVEFSQIHINVIKN